MQNALATDCTDEVEEHGPGDLLGFCARRNVVNVCISSDPSRPWILILHDLHSVIFNENDPSVIQFCPTPSDLTVHLIAPGPQKFIYYMLKPLGPAIEFLTCVPFNSSSIICRLPLAISARVSIATEFRHTILARNMLCAC